MNLIEYIESKREDQPERAERISAHSERQHQKRTQTRYRARGPLGGGKIARARAWKKSKSSRRKCIRSSTANRFTRPVSRRFFFTAITTCSRPSRSICGRRPAFEPTVRDGNLFGRGTADDKGQVHIHMKALEALQEPDRQTAAERESDDRGRRRSRQRQSVGFRQQNRERLKADALVVSDTSMLAKGVPSITYGLRGLNYYQVEITGPAQDLHSGVFGGAVPNPITILAETIAKLHDKNFRVTVPGFYDDVAAVLARKSAKR